MKELNLNEVQEVSGGFIINPVTIGLAINAANYAVAAYRTYKTVRTLTQVGAASGAAGFLDGIFGD